MTEHDDAGRPMMDIARGDQVASGRLRRNLEILQEKSNDNEFRRLIQDVLDGRRSLREAARLETFNAGMTPHMQKVEEKWDEVMAEDQEVVDEEQVETYKGLRAEVQAKMAEVDDSVRELQRYENDLRNGR